MTTPSLFNVPPLQAPQIQPGTPPLFSQAPAVPLAPAPQAQPAAPTAPALTIDDVKRALPQNLRHSVTQELVDNLNAVSTDPVAAENIRDNFIGYAVILKDGRFRTDDYLNAVAYVSYKLMGYSNEEAYARTFPGRYQILISDGRSKKDISAYVSAYHKGKLVNLIMEQALVPTWVLNQDLFQQALNVQADLMRNANSEKVRTDAANSILNHLKKPEGRDFQISLDVAESSGMKEMREMLGQLASQQRTLIQQGEMKTIDVAAARLINKEDATDV
jgi:hypothetical protein